MHTAGAGLHCHTGPAMQRLLRWVVAVGLRRQPGAIEAAAAAAANPSAQDVPPALLRAWDAAMAVKRGVVEQRQLRSKQVL